MRDSHPHLLPAIDAFLVQFDLPCHDLEVVVMRSRRQELGLDDQLLRRGDGPRKCPHLVVIDHELEAEAAAQQEQCETNRHIYKMMSSVGYKEVRYRDMRMLPPKVESSKCYGVLTITLHPPMWGQKACNHILIRFKFWGEAQPSVISLPSELPFTCYFVIVTPLPRLFAYLSDMKLLKIEFVDARNQKVLYVALMNFLMQRLELGIDEKVQILAIREKRKYGEVRVEMRVEGSGGEDGLIMVGMADQKRQPDPISTQSKAIGVEVGVNVGTPKITPLKPPILEEESFPRRPSQHQQPKRPNIENQEIIANMQQNTGPTFGFPTNSLSRQKKPPANGVPSTDRQQSPIRKKMLGQNFEAQMERLRLDELQLLSSRLLLTSPSNASLTLQIDRLQLPFSAPPSAYCLSISLPIILQGQLKYNVFEIPYRQCSHKEVSFKQSVNLDVGMVKEDEMKQYLGELATFKLKNQDKVLAVGIVKMAAVVGSLGRAGVLMVHMRGETRGKDGRRKVDSEQFGTLYLRCEAATERKSPQQTTIPDSPQPLTMPKPQPLPAPTLPPLHLCLSIRQFHNLLPSYFHSNNFLLRIKLGQLTFKSNTIWNNPQPDFKFSITAPFTEGVILAEIWNKGAEDRLVGVSRLEVGKVTQCNERNLFPVICFEDDQPVIPLKGGSVGFLGVVMALGTVQQINRYVMKHALQGKEDRKEQANKGGEKQQELKPQETQIPKPHFHKTDNEEQKDDISDKSKSKSSEHKRQHDISEQYPIHPPPANPARNLLELLNNFLFSLSKNPELCSALPLLPQSSLSMHQFRNFFASISPADKLCFFFLQDLKIPVSNVTSSLESHKLYAGLLLEQYGDIIKQLKQVMDYNGVTVSQLELELEKESDRDQMTVTKFRKVLRDLLPEFTPISAELLGKFASFGGVVRPSVFSDTIRRYDVYQEVNDIEVDADILSEFILSQMTDVLREEQEKLMVIYKMIDGKEKVIDYRRLVAMFQSIDIVVSVWESFNIIERIKKERDVNEQMLQGTISSEQFKKWIETLLPGPIVQLNRSPTFGQNLFPLKPLNEIVEIMEPSSILPSPIHAPSQTLEFNFGLTIERLFINNTRVYFVQKTNKIFEIRSPRQNYYQLEIYAEGETFRADGGHEEWLAVTDTDGEYIGAVRIL